MCDVISQVMPVSRTLDLDREQQILACCRNGDWSDYGILVDRYRRLVWSAVDSVLAGESVVADVVQEVFIRTYEKLHTYRGDSAFSSWLYRLARNHAIGHLRRISRRPRSVSLDDSDGGPDLHARLAGSSGPDTGYADQAREQALGYLLAKLPLEYREAVSLYYLGDYTYDGIAEILSVPLNTVKTRIRRGKQRLVDMARETGWRPDTSSSGLGNN